MRLLRASSRLDAMFFGGVDMAAELRASGEWSTLLYARSRVVHAAAGWGRRDRRAVSRSQ